MNEHDLMEALEVRATDVPVGGPPIDVMTRAARGARRRRGVGAALAAAVVVAGVGLGTSALVGGDDGGGSAEVASDIPAWQTPPAGMRYVGLGHAAIAVPAQWPDNATQCGTPKRSTVIIDQGVICLALYPYPTDTSSVEIRPAYEGEDFSGWTPAEVGGVEVLRSPDAETEPFSANDVEVFAANLYIPSEGVVFAAASSVSQADVGALLDRVEVFEDAVAVPGFQTVTVEAQEGAAAAYLDVLADAGLVGEQVDQVDRRKYPAGWVIATDPVPGTLVAPGSTVQVTVAR